MNDDKRDFWKKATPEVQEDNFEIFISLIEELKQDGYYLFKLFSQTDKNVLKNHNEELVELIIKNKDSALVVENIWKSLDKSHQQEQEKFFSSIINELLVQDKEIYNVWKFTNDETQSNMLDELLDRYDDAKKSEKIFRGLNIPLSQKGFETFLERSGVVVDNIEEVYEIYKNILRINKDANETINLNMFDSKILDIFNLEKIARITTYPEIQRKIVKLTKIKGFNSIIKSLNDDNWIMELDSLLKNVENYPELLEDIPNEEIGENSAQMLLQVFSQKENYFNIFSVTQAKNYFDVRKDICLRILNDEKIENLNPILENYSDEDRKRFAILEMMYGIDIDEAKNLVEKYGKDIEKIDVNKYGKSAEALLGIKRILECENISEEYQENKSVIDNESDKIHYTHIADLEAQCLDMYSQIYKETLYIPKESDKVKEVEYEGNKIDVYEINGDFNMFVRADGACNGYNEPENFAEKLSNINVKHHGNCRSFIGQDSIGIANSEGVKFGYSKCENGTLLMAASWDIMSNAANQEFSAASEKWNTNSGIQLRLPQEMINNTRHPYNEFDFEKLIYDEENKEFNGDKPQYIVYVKEPDVELEKDDKWRVSKKAAGQLNIPIVIIDREKHVKREWEKVEELQDILLGKRENKDNISEENLMENIILKFENNVNSVRGIAGLSKKYFTSEDRKNITDNIVKYIKSLESTDFNKYQQLFNKFKDIVQNERDKIVSNTGAKVANDRYGQGYLDALKQKCAQIETESKKRELTETYKRVGIEPGDLADAKKFLQNEKSREEKKDIQILE